MQHPLYQAAHTRLSPYEQTLADALSAHQPDWWIELAHHQARIDYIRARDDAARVTALVNMLREGVNIAHRVYRAISAIPEHGPAR